MWWSWPTDRIQPSLHTELGIYHIWSFSNRVIECDISACSIECIILPRVTLMRTDITHVSLRHFKQPGKTLAITRIKIDHSWIDNNKKSFIYWDLLLEWIFTDISNLRECDSVIVLAKNETQNETFLYCSLLCYMIPVIVFWTCTLCDFFHNFMISTTVYMFGKLVQQLWNLKIHSREICHFGR